MTTTTYLRDLAAQLAALEPVENAGSIAEMSDVELSSLKLHISGRIQRLQQLKLRPDLARQLSKHLDHIVEEIAARERAAVERVLGSRQVPFETMEEFGGCGCNGMCDWRGGCELADAAESRHKQTLIDLANERAHDAKGVRDECIAQARTLVKQGRRDLACSWLRMAMTKNREAVRCRRTAMQAARLVGSDFRAGDAMRMAAVPDYNKPSVRPWLMAAACLILVGCSLAMSGCVATYKYACGAQRLEIGSLHVRGSVAGIQQCTARGAVRGRK